MRRGAAPADKEYNITPHHFPPIYYWPYSIVSKCWDKPLPNLQATIHTTKVVVYEETDFSIIILKNYMNKVHNHLFLSVLVCCAG